MLRDNGRDLWSLGNGLCVDEDRVLSKSDRQKCKTRNPEKPIRMGVDNYKLCDRSKNSTGFVWANLPYACGKTYKNPDNSKMVDVVLQLLEDVPENEGVRVAVDNKFTCRELMDKMKLMGIIRDLFRQTLKVVIH